MQKQLAIATEKANADMQKAIEAQTESIVAFAKKAGYEFTAAELLASAQHGDKKLNVNELDAVAGGLGFCCFIGFGDTPETHDLCACAYIGVGWGYKPSGL